MLFFIFLVATLNLAVGYALGSGMTLSSILALIPRRTPKAVTGDIEDDEPLTRPAPKAKQPAKVAKAKPTAAPEKPDKTAEEPKKSSPTKADVLASLAGMREQMSQASEDLKQNQADPESFEQSANKLQEVNHAYLQEAEGTIKQLDELGAAGDTEATAKRDVVADGTTRIAAMSNEMDGLIEGGLDSDEARAQLVAKADAIDAASKEVEQSAESADPLADEPADEEEPTVDAASVDEWFDRLQSMLTAAGPDATQHVAALRIDPVADHEKDDELAESLLDQVAVLAAELLGESQEYISGQPSVLVLGGDSFEQATERLEKLRQQIEATTFDRHGDEIKATITCAITDATTTTDQDKVMEQLGEALEESGRLGANRTFHHDGAFATPVPEKVVKIKPKTIAIS